MKPAAAHRTRFTAEDRALAILLVADQGRTMQPEAGHILAILDFLEG